MRFILCLYIFVMLTLFVLKNNGQKYIYMIEEVVKSHGYTLETHHLFTTDNYMLTLHRIPYKRRSRKSLKKQVVLLMHGMFTASESFISLGPDNSIAYNLVDAGFDVWMGNARGTKNSRYHEDLDPDNPNQKKEFFDFTYEDIGLYDLAEMVDFILTLTEKKSLHYIGLGAGGTAFLVLNSLQPEYKEKFHSAHLLASLGYQKHFRNKQLASIAKYTNWYYLLKTSNSLGIAELFPPGSANEAVTGLEVPRYCTGNVDNADVCEMFGIKEITGESLLKALVDSEMAGTSVTQLAHFGQNIKYKKFSRWDFGKQGNYDEYETEYAPEYDLSEVTVNTTLHYSEGDHLVFEKDVLDMARDMPNCYVRKVPKASFRHFDYIINPAVKSLVTDYVVRSLKKHNWQLASRFEKEIFGPNIKRMKYIYQNYLVLFECSI